MKSLIGATLLSLIAGTAFAQGRPATPAMSCQAAARLVQARGAVVLTTGPDTYDRFVRDQGFCTREQTVEPARVPTLDQAECFVGYRCTLFAPRNGFSVPRR